MTARENQHLKLVLFCSRKVKLELIWRNGRWRNIVTAAERGGEIEAVAA